MEELARITELVTTTPGITTTELRDLLRADGRTSITTADILATLTATPQHFRPDTTGWARRQPGDPPPPPRRRSDDVPLYQWQVEALHAWRHHNKQGVIEAVTGTGKTRVGLIAASEELATGGQVLVLVPTRELQTQWQQTITTTAPSGTLVGLLGDGRHDTLADHDLIIAVINSARDRDLHPRRPGGLLIADECHRYASEENRRALTETFPHRLGLSATYARPDDGHLAWLIPYFGPTCYQLGYHRAAQDHVIAPFDITLIELECTDDERARYNDLTDQITTATAVLITRHHLPTDPYGAFLAAVSVLARTDTPAGMLARRYLAAMQERRQLLDNATCKTDLLHQLAPTIATAERTLIFTSSITAAETAADIVNQHGIKASALHSEQPTSERKRLMTAFRTGRHTVLVAPQVLDEGIDVPDADLAIVLGTSRSRRQMIQRLGRIVRRKPEGRSARFVLAYIRATIEDPATGAHHDFLNEITNVAQTITTTRPARDGWETLTAYLRP
jgi:superfamily II DNA or RNA helicase